MTTTRERHAVHHDISGRWCLGCGKPWPCDAIREADRADRAEADAAALAEALRDVLGASGLAWCGAEADRPSFLIGAEYSARKALAAYETRVTPEPAALRDLAGMDTHSGEVAGGYPAGGYADSPEMPAEGYDAQTRRQCHDWTSYQRNSPRHEWCSRSGTVRIFHDRSIVVGMTPEQVAEQEERDR